MKIGCAGWSLPRDTWPCFPAAGSHLARYGSIFAASEINASFYRPLRFELYAKWADAVPAAFRFSVKLPRAITHAQRLVDPAPLLDAFLAQVRGLGDRLGCLLVQLPPSLVFDAAVATTFVTTLRERHGGAVALEPRHASWFQSEADALLGTARIARVLADPVRHSPGTLPGGWPGLVYLRLHGSPRMYYSSYGEEMLDALALRMKQGKAEGADVWCVFDNTASGAAVRNALGLITRIRGVTPSLIDLPPEQRV